jgi:hypothetical protein
MMRAIKTLLITCGVIILAIVVIESLLRYKYKDTAYVPGGTVTRIQSYLTLHPKLGFTWKPNIKYDENIVIPWQDQVVEPLSTGWFGFPNHPRAIEALRKGRPIDILGIGDSQMQVAALDLHRFFWEQGLFYYSMAVHRYSPPQYNIVMKEYGIGTKPRWIVYGVFENDFEDVIDFDNWRKTDLDWFAYHSGTWGGPPVSVNPVVRFMKTHLRGVYAYYRATRQMIKRGLLKASEGHGVMTNAGVRLEKDRVSRIYNYVKEAHDLATSHQINFVLLLIPSRGTMEPGSTFKARLYDELLKMLEGSGVWIIDLRHSYSEVPDPLTLYYHADSHWNKNGDTLAAEQVLAFIRKTEAQQRQSLLGSPRPGQDR